MIPKARVFNSDPVLKTLNRWRDFGEVAKLRLFAAETLRHAQTRMEVWCEEEPDTPFLSELSDMLLGTYGHLLELHEEPFSKALGLVLQINSLAAFRASTREGLSIPWQAALKLVQQCCTSDPYQAAHFAHTGYNDLALSTPCSYTRAGIDIVKAIEPSL